MLEGLQETGIVSADQLSKIEEYFLASQKSGNEKVSQKRASVSTVPNGEEPALKRCVTSALNVGNVLVVFVIG